MGLNMDGGSTTGQSIVVEGGGVGGWGDGHRQAALAFRKMQNINSQTKRGGSAGMEGNRS